MKIRLQLLAALATAVAAPAFIAPATAAAPSIDIHPAKLQRGEAARIPHMEGRTIVDGAVRVRAPNDTYLLGRSGKAYVVVGAAGLIRITRNGTQRTIARLPGDADPRLSSDGHRVVTPHYLRHGKTRITVFDAVTGERIASRIFTKSAFVLDAFKNRVVLSASAPDRTVRWNYRLHTTSRVIGRMGETADIAANRLATFTGDPYEGGCTVVSSLHHPRQVLWRSCSQAVLGFSPTGARMATDFILSDGPGPSIVHVRRTDGGKRLATYKAPYVFGAVAWETRRAILLETQTPRKAAVVRCASDGCERASRIWRNTL